MVRDYWVCGRMGQGTHFVDVGGSSMLEGSVLAILSVHPLASAPMSHQKASFARPSLFVLTIDRRPLVSASVPVSAVLLSVPRVWFRDLVGSL